MFSTTIRQLLVLTSSPRTPDRVHVALRFRNIFSLCKFRLMLTPHSLHSIVFVRFLANPAPVAANSTSNEEQVGTSLVPTGRDDEEW